jgi:peptide deformylase
MALLDILHFPDPRLREVAKPVEQVDASVKQLVDDMFETMYDAPGIGLAAIQVNVPMRVITVDISEDQDEPLALINPEITSKDGIEEMKEGCLSVPGVFEMVQRADKITVKFLNRDGESVRFVSNMKSITSMANCLSTISQRLSVNVSVQN